MASAFCDGQWTQARKAAVPDWKIEDSNCQLCFGQVGTLEHRFCCPVTIPEKGWPVPPPRAAKALAKLSEQRCSLLKTRGMLVMKVPVRMPDGQGSFIWQARPDENDPRMEGAVWYFDGSMLNGKWQALRATGFGIVVVSVEGDLLGFGRGTPPHWCTTAAAAEAWALQEVLAQCPFPPQMRTDCQALLATVAGGVQRATAADKKLARIWRKIANMLGGCFKSFAESKVLVWMPAHQTTASVGEVKLSSGARLSMLDWRANRLVDALAKMSAAEAQCMPACLGLVEAAAVALRHAAMLLGRVTHAANNHVVYEPDDSGNQVAKVRRDAVQCERVRKRRLSPVAAKAAAAGDGKEQALAVAALPPPLKARRTTVEALRQGRRSREAEAATLSRRVRDIGAALVAPVGQSTASDRLEAVRRRLDSRLSGKAT